MNAVFLLPLIFISQANMTRSQKISASITFVMGAVNIVVTLIRWLVVQSVFDGIGNPPLTTAGKLKACI
jgi:sugar phosphate permease